MLLSKPHSPGRPATSRPAFHSSLSYLSLKLKDCESNTSHVNSKEEFIEELKKYLSYNKHFKIINMILIDFKDQINELLILGFTKEKITEFCQNTCKLSVYQNIESSALHRITDRLTYGKFKYYIGKIDNTMLLILFYVSYIAEVRELISGKKYQFSEKYLNQFYPKASLSERSLLLNGIEIKFTISQIIKLESNQICRLISEIHFVAEMLHQGFSTEQVIQIYTNNMSRYLPVVRLKEVHEPYYQFYKDEMEIDCFVLSWDVIHAAHKDGFSYDEIIDAICNSKNQRGDWILYSFVENLISSRGYFHNKSVISQYYKLMNKTKYKHSKEYLEYTKSSKSYSCSYNSQETYILFDDTKIKAWHLNKIDPSNIFLLSSESDSHLADLLSKSDFRLGDNGIRKAFAIYGMLSRLPSFAEMNMEPKFSDGKAKTSTLFTITFNLFLAHD